MTTVILTHSGGDHVNGLVSFPAGLTIIAHENNKKEQEAALAARARGFHWAPAHTGGDLVVYLPARKIVLTRDIITGRPEPLIHADKHGSSEGWITTPGARRPVVCGVHTPKLCTQSDSSERKRLQLRKLRVMTHRCLYGARGDNSESCQQREQRSFHVLLPLSIA